MDEFFFIGFDYSQIQRTQASCKYISSLGLGVVLKIVFMYIFTIAGIGIYTNDTTLTIWMLIEKSWTKILRIPLKISVPRENKNEYLFSEPTNTMNDYIFPIHILEHGEVLMSCDGNMLVVYVETLIEKKRQTRLFFVLHCHLMQSCMWRL